jgi:CRP-like cAMP-binding protein
LVEDEIDARADVFSLGVVAYEWLAGHRPYSGETVDLTLKAVLESRPIPLRDIGPFDPELSDAIDRALSRQPAQRFGSADAFADALEVCQEHWLKQNPTHGTSRLTANAPTEKLPRLPTRNLLFADFSESDLAEVMATARQESYPAGETILQQGAGGSTLYVTVHGRVSVRIRSGSCDVEIKQIGPGEFFGEMAVVSQMPRSATVLALEPTELIAISGAVLRLGNPELCRKLYRNIAALLADRVRDADEQVARLLEVEPPAAPNIAKTKTRSGKKGSESKSKTDSSRS